MMLSRVGKEVLIKVVAQSTPTYTMGVFQLPVKLCDKLNALCDRFWWDQVGNERKFTGRVGIVFLNQKMKGGWGFEIKGCLTLPCLLNKVGEKCMIMSLFFLNGSKRDTSLGAIFLIWLNHLTVRMYRNPLCQPCQF